MAQSQVPFPYANDNVAALRTALSEARFGPYLAEAKGDAAFALELYLYNSRLAKAFLFPLNTVEVSVRNAVDEVLIDRYGTDWHTHEGFRQDVLTGEGLNTLDKAIARVGPSATKDQVVATLTFDFWSNMLRREYATLWRTHLNRAFPNVATVGSRHEVQQLVRDINWFRNRVAHHEPIFRSDVNATYAKMLDAVGMRCLKTQEWMRYHSTVGVAVRTRPRTRTGADRIIARLDAGFVAVAPETTLLDLFRRATESHPAIVVVDSQGCPTAAFTIAAASAYVAEVAAVDGGLIDLTGHTVADVEKYVGGFAGSWIALNSETAITLAIAEFQKPKIRVMVGTDPGSGKAVGALVRSHRRY